MFEMFTHPFMQMALAAITLTGISCGYLSVYVVLKRLVFLTITLAQIASVAVVIATYLPAYLHVDPMVAALVSVLIGGLAFSWSGVARYLPRENSLGTVYALASAAGVLLLSKSALAESSYQGLLFRDVLTVRPVELWVMVAVVVVVGTLHLVFRKEFMLSSFDPEMAQTLGVKTRLWEVIFFVTLGLIIAVAIRLAGVILIFALLVMPGYAALLARCRVVSATLWAMVIAAVGGAAGLVIEWRLDLPASATIIVVLGIAVVVAAVVGRIREFASAVPQATLTAGHRARVALAWAGLLIGIALVIVLVAQAFRPTVTPSVSPAIKQPVAGSAGVSPTAPAASTSGTALVPEASASGTSAIPKAPSSENTSPTKANPVPETPRPVAPPPPPPPPPPATALPADTAHASVSDLLQAIDRSDTEKVSALLRQDSTLAKAKGEKGMTPLHWLAKSATVEPAAATTIAEALLAAGADVDARTDQGETPLLTAAWNSSNKGVMAVAKTLIAHNADVNAKDTDGDTPLSSALDPDFCKLLTDHGAK